MTVSKKQLKANKKNAQKGGVKTPEGKAIVKYNALKHVLLAKEVVITVGEGAESPEEFNDLLGDLKTQLNPVGTLEEMLVDKVAVGYWRLRRAYRYEVGLIRKELDTATDDFYSKTNYKDDKDEKITSMTEYYYLIEHLSPQCSNKPFHKWILPWTSVCSTNFLYAIAFQKSSYSVAINAIIIPEKILLVVDQMA